MYYADCLLLQTELIGPVPKRIIIFRWLTVRKGRRKKGVKVKTVFCPSVEQL
jgi:hypothetical protein